MTTLEADTYMLQQKYNRLNMMIGAIAYIAKDALKDDLVRTPEDALREILAEIEFNNRNERIQA